MVLHWIDSGIDLLRFALPAAGLEFSFKLCASGVWGPGILVLGFGFRGFGFSGLGFRDLSFRLSET